MLRTETFMKMVLAVLGFLFLITSQSGAYYVDPKKIGRTRRGFPIVGPEELPKIWDQYSRAVILAAVGARGARKLIRARLNDMGFVEGSDWWGVA